MLVFEDEARLSASEVERRARALARGAEGFGLREWVDTLGAHMTAPASADPVTGSILVERATPPAPGDPDQTVWQRAPTPGAGPRARTPPARLTPAETTLTPATSPPPPSEVLAPTVAHSPTPPAVPQPAPPKAGASRGALWAGLALLLLTVTGVGLWLARDEEPSPGTAEGAPGHAGAGSPGTPVPPHGDLPDAGAPKQGDVVAQPGPGGGPVGTTAPPTGPPPTPANASSRKTPDRVTVGLSGDAKQVSLVPTKGGETVRLPGKVLPGNYNILVGFGGEPETSIYLVTIKAGRPLTINCDSGFGKCLVSGAP